jgi:hypothetical protein
LARRVRRDPRAWLSNRSRCNNSALERLYLAGIVDPADMDAHGLRSDLKSADDGRSGGIGERTGCGSTIVRL